MKRKIIYILIAALMVITIIISIFVSRQTIKIQSLLEEGKIERAPAEEQVVFSDYTHDSPMIFDTTSKQVGITVIKPLPAAEEEELSFIEETREEEIKKRKQRRRGSVSSSQSPAVSGGDTSDLPDEPDPGVTKIGRQPTEKEQEEMNAQGIVMY